LKRVSTNMMEWSARGSIRKLRKIIGRRNMRSRKTYGGVNQRENKRGEGEK